MARKKVPFYHILSNLTEVTVLKGLKPKPGAKIEIYFS